MLDLEDASSLVRMAHKDFNALLGMQGNDLFADEILDFMSRRQWERHYRHGYASAELVATP